MFSFFLSLSPLGVSDEEDQKPVRLPLKVAVELQPRSNHSWTRVQSLAHNPRLRSVPIGRVHLILLDSTNQRLFPCDCHVDQVLTEPVWLSDLFCRMVVELHRKVSSLIEFLKQKWAVQDQRIVSFCHSQVASTQLKIDRQIHFTGRYFYSGGFTIQLNSFQPFSFKKQCHIFIPACI